MLVLARVVKGWVPDLPRRRNMNIPAEWAAGSAGLFLVYLLGRFWEPIGKGLHCSCHGVDSVPITVISLMRVKKPTRCGWTRSGQANTLLRAMGLCGTVTMMEAG